MAQEYDVIVIGGGLAGAALSKKLAEGGLHVLVLERELAFRDRVRGEQMHCWGVAEARTLGLYDLLLETCGHEVRYWSQQFVGFSEPRERDLVMSTPHRAGSLNFYHPEMQSVVLDAAEMAGVTVRRAVRVIGVGCGSLRSVCVHEDGNGDRIYHARLLVGADGRNSACRRWGGFRVERDTEGMIISGLLLTGLRAPEDRLTSFLNPRRGMLSLTVPIGRSRFRTYVCIHKSSSEFRSRPISGRTGISDFFAASIAAGAPASWYESAQAAGPLASFSAADTWVTHPHREGIVLIGDAAASNDPSFGCGLSLTLRDVRVLADHLLASEDGLDAADAYAAEHDRHYGAIHHLTDWARELFYNANAAAIPDREGALSRLVADRSRALDIIGLGPECPADESHRRRFLGED